MKKQVTILLSLLTLFVGIAVSFSANVEKGKERVSQSVVSEVNQTIEVNALASVDYELNSIECGDAFCVSYGLIKDVNPINEVNVIKHDGILKRYDYNSSKHYSDRGFKHVASNNKSDFLPEIKYIKRQNTRYWVM